MKRSRTFLLFAVVLAGCASQQVSRPHQQALPESAAASRKEMEKRDARLRAQFKKITIGMSAGQVRDVMGTEPQVSRDNVWQFKLSRDSFGACSEPGHRTMTDAATAGSRGEPPNKGMQQRSAGVARVRWDVPMGSVSFGRRQFEGGVP
jgi:hypothetical protein